MPPLFLQEVVRQAEALYDTLMKAKSGPSQPSKPASSNWASSGWKRGADSGSTGIVSPCDIAVHPVLVLRGVAFSGSYQKWQRTDDNWKGKYAQTSHSKDAAAFKGKCNGCGERGHKLSECPKAQAQKPS